MELRHFRYFIAAAEELNFRRAAVRLRIAQPALSVQIRQLETEIKAQLFSREGRGIKLTEAGRVFLDQARKTLADVARGVALAQHAANGDIGHLVIGHNGPAELLAFPAIVPAFKEKWPKIHLSFQNYRTPQQIDRLRSDELDLGFVWMPIPADEFDILELMSVPLGVALPTGHRLAGSKILSVSDLSNEPLILFSRRRDPDSFHQIEELFLAAGATLNIVYEFELLLSVINFVAMGSGLSLLPDYHRRIGMPGVVYRPLKPPNIVKHLAVVKKKGAGGAVNNFFHFSADILAAASLRTERTATAG
jgi:DNA-binding transcriptional LysR family regulator